MKTKVFFAIAMVTIFSLNITAQDKEKRFGIELSGGASFAIGKLNDASLNPGFGFEGILHYRFIDFTGIYAGWGWNRFGADESFAGNDVCFEETGYVLGIQFKHPVGATRLDYYVRAGGLYNHIEIENAEGEIIKDSGHGVGWQAAAGLDVDLGKNWSLTPGLKFNSLNRSVDHEGVSIPLNQNYISVRVGILKKF